MKVYIEVYERGELGGNDNGNEVDMNMTLKVFLRESDRSA